MILFSAVLLKCLYMGIILQTRKVITWFTRRLLWYCRLVTLVVLVSPVMAETIAYVGISSVNTNPHGLSLSGIVITPGTASNNLITIDYPSDRTDPDYIFGGLSKADPVSGNIIHMMSGRVAEDVVGGLNSESGNVSSNNIILSGGRIDGSIMAGWGTEGNALQNNVIITAGTVAGDVVAGYSETRGNASWNRVLVSGGVVDGDILSSFSVDGDATYNHVLLTGGTVNGRIYSGYSDMYGDALWNSMFISGGIAGRDLIGGWSVNGNASYNNISISGGEVTGNIYGGYSDWDGNATHNTILISGGVINGNVYSGYSLTGHTQYNSVTLTGTPLFGPAASIVGGYGPGEALTGNPLTVDNYSGSAMSRLGNFQYYNFLLPATAGSGHPVLTVTGAANLDYAQVQSIHINSGGGSLRPGENLVLINAGTLSALGMNTSVQGKQGLALDYDFSLITSQNSLYAIVRNVRVNPDTKSFSQGRLAGLALMNQAHDLISGAGMESVIRTMTQDDPSGIVAFGATTGSSMRYKAGSRIDVDAASLIAGMVWKQTLFSGSVLVGPFFEAGWGNYNSYNRSANAVTVKGDGDSNYYGGGILVRFNMTEGPLTGFYADGSVRAGTVENDFKSVQLTGMTGLSAAYNHSVSYYGLHAGIGYLWKINDKISLDFSSRYMWAHENEGTIVMGGDPFYFESMNTQRWRNSVRADYAFNESAAAYIGAAYEYEFDGKANASVYRYALDRVTLKGGTGIFELGVMYHPAKRSPVSFNFAVSGYTGTREGYSGSIQLVWKF